MDALNTMASSIEIRGLAARDSMQALTELLHRAYAPLAGRGMNFTAATQSAETTARRAAEGHCFIAERRGRVVGTVTVCGPYEVDTAPWAANVPAFRDRDTAHFHQFAVDPDLQRQGLGRRLVAACESWALQHGYKRMALDTAEPATELRALYRRLGYAEVAQVHWEGKAYRSVIMEKALDRSPLREQLRLLARYNLWATRRLFDALDALPEADHRRDAGLFFKSVHGTLNHLLVGEHALWFRRFADGVSPSLALDAEIESDRAALKARLIDGAAAWLAELEGWSDARLQGSLAYQRMNGEAVTLPFSAALTHVFNHATHHRGQITAALTAMGHRCPELDMVFMLQQEAAAATPQEAR
jgi:uncharacterized damage-inducible protein DinB/GNAT superfamily N-acetyltransferase